MRYEAAFTDILFGELNLLPQIKTVDDLVDVHLLG
jgi:hypothetical protein